MQAPAGLRGGSGGAQGVPTGPIAPTSYIVDRLEQVGPAETPLAARRNLPATQQEQQAIFLFRPFKG